MPLAADLFQVLALLRLRQPVALAIEQLCRAAEEATVGKHLPEGRIGLADATIVQRGGVQVALFDLVLGQQQLPAQAGLFKQQQGGAGAQVGLGEPAPPLLGVQGQPVLDLVLLDWQLLLQHLEHGLVTVAVGVEAITQTQRLAGVVEHAGVGEPPALEHGQQAIGHDAVEVVQAWVGGAAAQQLQRLYCAVVGQEPVVAIVAPVHFGGLTHQVLDLVAVEPQGHRRQAAQFGLGVLVDHLAQRQHEQARGVGTDQAVPAGKLHIVDEGAVRQHQALVEVQAAVRPAWAARLADHQAQHAVAPAADQVLVGFGQQVVHLIDPLGVDFAQRLAGEVAAGIDERQALGAAVLLRCPAEVFAQVLVQRRTAAAVARVEEEVLHVDRDVLLGAAQFIAVGAAHELAVVLLALAASAHVLLPAGQVEQARVVAEGEAALGLATACFGQADLAQRTLLALATGDQRVLGAGPQPGTVVDMGEFV
ncbi:hypothetical protein D3C81_980700 [compost metagenome]